MGIYQRFLYRVDLIDSKNSAPFVFKSQGRGDYDRLVGVTVGLVRMAEVILDS